VIGHILLALAVLTAYCLFVLARPHVRCWRCLGRRVVRVSGPRRRRMRRCPVCRARGIARMPLAGPVHRMFWALAGDRMLAKRRDQAAALLATRKDTAA
jgi:hypothetical protein